MFSFRRVFTREISCFAPSLVIFPSGKKMLALSNKKRAHIGSWRWRARRSTRRASPRDASSRCSRPSRPPLPGTIRCGPGDFFHKMDDLELAVWYFLKYEVYLSTFKFTQRYLRLQHLPFWHFFQKRVDTWSRRERNVQSLVEPSEQGKEGYTAPKCLPVYARRRGRRPISARAAAARRT